MQGGPRVGFFERYGLVLALLVAGTMTLIVVLLRGGLDPSQVGRAYLLSVGAIVIAALVLALRRAAPDPRSPSAADLRSAGTRFPPELEALQDSVRVSRVSHTHYQSQVVPLLREIAADRLLLLGISLERDQARAAAALGPQLTALLLDKQPDGGSAARRGPQARDLDRVLDALTAVGR